MKITDLAAFGRISRHFENGDFKQGTVSELPIYVYEEGRTRTKDLTPGHFVYAMKNSNMSFNDVPKEFLTRDFFIHALSDAGNGKDIITYVKAHIGDQFDREFFKDYIATNQWSLDFEQNCFEYMPLDYIDEEMISCAMIKAVGNRYVERRGDSDDWFYSVAKRKPEVLIQDFWTLGARCFASRRHGKNEFLDMTPEQYKTEEYYFAMCLANDTPVMEDFPEEILTTNFLVQLINDSADNIKSFSAKALEKTAPMNGRDDKVKFWQAAILFDGYLIRNIPFNDERVEFFLANYDKDSSEYRYGFKDEYKRYLRRKEKKLHGVLEDSDTKIAANLMLSGAMCGIGLDDAVDIANADLQAGMNRTALLPIKYDGGVPKEFCKKYDQEEYLSVIYKKLGIEVVGEHDRYYYEVKLPKNFKVNGNSGSFCLMDGDKCILKYLDVGPFYDRSVYVKEINCSL